MFIHYRSKGIIFRKTDRGEADQLLTIYTKDFGKLEILGKAVRKTSSKLRSGAEIFYLSEIEFIQGKAHKTLTDAILIEKFKNIRNDFKKLTIAYKISEVLDNLVSGQEPDEKLWQLLCQTFERLDKLKIICPVESPQTFLRGKLKIIYYYFLWNFFSILGYQPELYNCILCQKRVRPGNLYFDAKQGGITCQNCFKKLKLDQEINLETIKILRIICGKNWQLLTKLKIEKNHLESLAKISKSYLSYIEEIIK